MSKKRFVQAVIARSLPSHEKRQAALAYAEDLWGWLGSQGYGDDKPSEPREGIVCYKNLSDRQKHWFDRFWLAFDLKIGKERSAMRWGQLGELSDSDYSQIVEAARLEARRELPQGQARKRAEGWLFESRYQDHATPAPGKLVKKYNEVAKLTADLNSLKKLYNLSKDEALLEQISKLEGAIKQARLQ